MWQFWERIRNLWIDFQCISLPTTSEIESDEITKLGQRLKGKSDGETLTNILEWQDRNITFWFERYPMQLILIVLGVVVFISGVLEALESALSSMPLDLDVTTIFFTIELSVFGLTLFMISDYRKLPLSAFFKAFSGKLALDFLIKNKLAVCRDYANLTACLLKSIYSDEKNEKKIVFLKSCGHVATGMYIDGQLYMLDQHLPIKTKNGWHKRNKSNKTEYILNDQTLRKETIEIKELEFDPDELRAEIRNRFTFSENKNNNDVLEFPVIWKQGALYYENDELVNYSLERWLRNELMDALIDVTKLCDIKVEQIGKDGEIRKDGKNVRFIVNFEKSS